MMRRMVLALIPLFLLAACFREPTELRPGVSMLGNDQAAFDADFQARLDAAFPPGTAASEVASRLRADGFTVNARRGYAEYHVGGLSCVRKLTLDWRGPEVIESIDARMRTVCLL